MNLLKYLEQVTVGKEMMRPYIIAEAGVNHEGKIDIAKRLIDEAFQGGADAIKFQSYKAKSLASKNSPSYWDLSKEPTTSQFQLFQKYDSFWKNEYEELAKHAQQTGIEFLSTPFDFESADFLEPLMPAYKIASADITNYPLLEHVAEKDKPILLSTGASTIEEIRDSVQIVKNINNEIPVVLLHCVLNYPTDLKNANLGIITDLSERFTNHIIGYSDHTMAKYITNVIPTAWLLGAQIIEKHFTHDKTLPGNDHYHAMDWKDLQSLKKQLDHLRLFIGSKDKIILPSEELSRKNARRSLVAARSIKAGATITEADIAIKRPGTGISPIHYKEVINSVAQRDMEEDDIIQDDDIKKRK